MPASIEAALRAAVRRPPGLVAQLRMAPRPRPGGEPNRPPDGLRPAAALLLLYPGADGWSVPLTVRAGTLRRHTGQVSLPGGGIDAGESIEAAAIREAHEEIAVPPDVVRIVGRLTALPIPVSGYLLHPVLAIADARPTFRPSGAEVARLLEVPLARLRDPGAVRHERRTRLVDGRSVEIDVPYFAIDDAQVWGATAMVLAEFLAVLDAAARQDVRPS